jgi:hypothetical protein
MCFSKPKAPGPDPGLEAQKQQQADVNTQRIADEKDEETRRQRGLVYGLFGPRSLIAGAGPGQTDRMLNSRLTAERASGAF